jgi:hypothetical protein
MKSRQSSEVRFLYHRTGFESAAGHHVRSKMESVVCDWLMHHSIAHRHASEMFTVRIGVAGSPTVYVPDIILHDKDSAGRTVIIEPFDAYTPRQGSTRIIACFRKEMKKEYFIVVVVKKQHMKKVLKDAYDLLIDFDNLDRLEDQLPLPDR